MSIQSKLAGSLLRGLSRRIADWQRRRGTIATLRSWSADDLDDIRVVRRGFTFEVW